MNHEDFVRIHERRCWLFEDIAFFRAAKKMRLSARKYSDRWNIAYEAGKVFERRAAEWIESLGGMAGEW